MGTKLKFALFAAVFAVTCAFAVDFCNFVFSCGCQSMWLAGSDHCNIHHRTGPHCPWCTHGGAGFVISFVPVFFTQGWVVFRQGGGGWKSRLLIALGAFPVIAGGVGALVGWVQGYWN